MPEPTEFNDPFSHFDPEVPMPLSAADVRRRGDRLRLRNTGLVIAGGVAAVALIVAPLAVLTGGDNTDALPPAGQSTTTVVDPPPAPQALVTRIPDDFPLDAGYPDANEDATPVEVVRDASTADFRLCQGGGFSPPTPSALSDAAAARFLGGEDSRDRLLTVWQDAEGARAALSEVKDILLSCSGGDVVYAEETSPSGRDSAVFSVQFAGPDGELSSGPLMSLGIIEAVRVENALYLARYEGETASGPGAVAAGVRRASEASAPVLAAAYDVFGGDAPAPTGAEPSQASPGPTDDLSSFPLAMDWPDPTGVEPGKPGLEGPSSELEQPIDYRVCDNPLPIPDTAGDLRARFSNVGDYRSRRLLTFNDAGEAVAFMTAAREFNESCTEYPSDFDDSAQVNETIDTPQGGQSFAAFYFTEVGGQPSIGLRVSQFIRLGRAVLIDTRSGEGTRSSAPGLLDAMSLATANVVAEMCAFTDAGC